MSYPKLEALRALWLRMQPFIAEVDEINAHTLQCVYSFINALPEDRQRYITVLSTLRCRLYGILRFLSPNDPGIEEAAFEARLHEEKVVLPFARGELSRAELHALDVEHMKTVFPILDGVMNRLGIPQADEFGIQQALDTIDVLHGVPPGTSTL